MFALHFPTNTNRFQTVVVWAGVAAASWENIVLSALAVEKPTSTLLSWLVEVFWIVFLKFKR